MGSYQYFYSQTKKKVDSRNKKKKDFALKISKEDFESIRKIVKDVVFLSSRI